MARVDLRIDFEGRKGETAFEVDTAGLVERDMRRHRAPGALLRGKIARLEVRHVHVLREGRLHGCVVKRDAVAIERELAKGDGP